MSDLSKLTKDLQSLPALIGNTGLAIAAAQKEFNLAYLEDLERTLIMIGKLLPQGDETEGAQQIVALLQQLGPTRYQFTETEIEFRADLGQSMRAAGELGVSVPAIGINASFSMAFGYDYRAAARVRSVIHAVPASQETFNALLDRAKEVGTEAEELPAGTPELDKALADASGRIAARLKKTT